MIGRFQGMGLAVVSGIFMVANVSLTQYLQEISASEICVYAHGIAASLSLPVVIARFKGFGEINRRTVFLCFVNILILTAASILKRAAYQLLPLGEASSIVFSTPFFAAVFARIIFKDKLTWMVLISLFISFVGMALTAKVPLIIALVVNGQNISSSDRSIGYAYAFISVIFSSMTFMVIRGLRRVPPDLYSLIQNVGVAIISVGVVFATGEFHYPPCTPTKGIALVSLGVTMCLAVISLCRALQLEIVAYVTTIYRSTDILLAFVFQLIIFKDGVNAYSVSGAVLVAGSGILLPLQRWMEHHPRWKNSFFVK